jgi:hypothetical protein
MPGEDWVFTYQGATGTASVVTALAALGIYSYLGSGSAGGTAVDDLPGLTALAATVGASAAGYGTIWLHGIVQLSANWAVPWGIGLMGDGNGLDRFDGTWTGGTVICPLNNSVVGAGAGLVSFGVYNVGWIQAVTNAAGSHPNVMRLGFSGRKGAVPGNASQAGLWGLCFEWVADTEVFDVGFEGFDDTGAGAGGVVGGGCRHESSASTSTGGATQGVGGRLQTVYTVNCALGIAFVGTNVTDCRIGDHKANGCAIPLLLGSGGTDNAGGAIISDGHYSAGSFGAAGLGANLTASPNSGNTLPAGVSYHLYANGVAKGTVQITGYYFDHTSGDFGSHIYMGSYGFQIANTKFWSNENQVSPFIICASGSSVSTPALIMDDTCKFFSDTASYNGSVPCLVRFSGAAGAPQFVNIKAPLAVGMFGSRTDSTANGQTVTVTANSPLVLDTGASALDVNCPVSAANFPNGTYIVSVIPGTSFVTSQPAIGNSAQVVIYNNIASLVITGQGTATVTLTPGAGANTALPPNTTIGLVANGANVAVGTSTGIAAVGAAIASAAGLVYSSSTGTNLATGTCTITFTGAITTLTNIFGATTFKPTAFTPYLDSAVAPITPFANQFGRLELPIMSPTGTA